MLSHAHCVLPLTDLFRDQTKVVGTNVFLMEGRRENDVSHVEGGGDSLTVFD